VRILSWIPRWVCPVGADSSLASRVRRCCLANLDVVRSPRMTAAEGRRPQINRLFCKPVCKPDAAGQLETGETEPTERDGIWPVRRGHHTRERRPETPETCVVWLITQRSRVQIPPPLPKPEAGSRTENRPLACLMLTNLRTVAGEDPFDTASFDTARIFGHTFDYDRASAGRRQVPSVRARRSCS
jgi:hypothetical protein